ncbi:hypothetical protein ACB098_02G165000 [Castanea mollissima]|uniref:Uncharacterized protein n=1 Tax=Castanea mollissima TaxID=60419 RepID=A0A8J4VXM0_9ROSI|nr:cell number regulator 2-like [Quercus robur]KAF3974860.1 hypothetical protein CMV_001840 [Castanea mollissima]
MYSSSDGDGKYGPQGYPRPLNMAPRQPYPTSYIPSATPWSTGLCHCFDDPANCLITCICPCITFGQIAEIVNKGSVSCAASGSLYGLLLGLTALPCLYSCFYRSRLRGQYDLAEDPCVDCLVHFCCETCALCQEYRELRSRGFDMGIGWQANMERQSRGVTLPPVVGGMTR